MQVDLRKYYEIDKILEDLRTKIGKVRRSGDTIDYLTFMPDGEPTLDINLDRGFELLGRFGINCGNHTNTSLKMNA